ncbi:hypothetical protein EV198_1471 [Roseivirga ehrenbergii]|uniref:Uncharacterized protein n=1 Tax=Roseivirga ehrenbergii (strain DSM 102268 / JCM 13514 / KCTC 12282 / NCIMB 14502 / KMM 6017) TaxID=279360 RepID=A0A150XIM4_ROSEK|nr:hypothetical protein [Roseivirga ehrenbergii]KYG78588.1 hypothetical protein MB14_17815 [Roseivirga ehrenbergii]TCL10441.1 hypothetical protein EV198_1471 [Roseivirga ehrenbergii]
MKAQPHIDLGTGYVQVSKLPFDQVFKLREWLPQTSFVKLNLADQILEDCIQYSEYEYWFDFQYSGMNEFEFEI